MKKFIVKYKDGGKVYGEYSSRKEASDKLMEHINNFNKYFEGEYLSPFDFVLEVVEISVADLIPDFEYAKRYLNLKGPNEKHKEALIALDKLFTIAEAWNKIDGFVPDFSNRNQWKYFPWFTYDDDAEGFVFEKTHYTAPDAKAYFGARLCFKTEKRAEQFGKQFIELYNKAFLITNK